MEWIRTTVLLTIVLIGVPLMKVWYVTGVVTFLFGIAAFLYLHYVFASGDSLKCKDTQTTRYQWLLVEVVFFWTLFFAFQAPMGVFCFTKRAKLNELLQDSDSETQEDD